MAIDWTLAKKVTLWQYDELLEKIMQVFTYDFVNKFYNHTMDDAIVFSKKAQDNYLINGKRADFITEIIKHFDKLNHIRIKNYQDLIDQVKSKTHCEAFLKRTHIRFEALIAVLNFLFRWVLPFKSPVKELLETFPDEKDDYMKILKKHKIRFNLDVLELCRFKTGRVKLASTTGLPLDYIFELTNRADISRLAYVRGKTINHLCAAGYNSLEKLARADLQQMEKDMIAYYATTGRKFSEFKNVIPLDWMIGGAKILPGILESDQY